MKSLFKRAILDTPITVVLYLIISKMLTFRFIPTDYHPFEWALIIIGAIYIGLSYATNDDGIFSFSVFALCLGWAAFILAILDHACRAGFVGFLSIAILYTLPYFAHMDHRHSRLDGGLKEGIWEGIQKTLYISFFAGFSIATILSIYAN